MTSYTSNTKLGKPALADRNWNVPLNANCDTLEAMAPLSNLAVTTYEVPSASLNVGVAPGTFCTPWGAKVTYAGVAPQAMTASVSNYVYLLDDGTLTISTSSFPASTIHVPLAVVVAGTATITSITDARCVASCVVPIAQPSGAAETALTDSTGGTPSVSYALVDVTATPTQALINDNFATVAVLLNKLRADIVALGLIHGS
jgi:hypothetical protein